MVRVRQKYKKRWTIQQVSTSIPMQVCRVAIVKVIVFFQPWNQSFFCFDNASSQTNSAPSRKITWKNSKLKNLKIFSIDGNMTDYEKLFDIFIYAIFFYFYR